MGAGLGEDVGDLRRYEDDGLSKITLSRWRRSIMKKLINTMWGFWLLLLVFSLGVAAAIYEIWLKGRI